MSQLALSYLSGFSIHSRHLISDVIDRTRCFPEGMARCFTLRPVLLLGMAKSGVVPVGWKLEAGWVMAWGLLTSMFLWVIHFTSLLPAGLDGLANHLVCLAFRWPIKILELFWCHSLVGLKSLACGPWYAKVISVLAVHRVMYWGVILSTTNICTYSFLIYTAQPYLVACVSA